MSIIAAIPVFILVAVSIVLPFIVGVYVYRDAKRRDMNAILWALVSVAAPALIGLIVYLLVRGNYSSLRCPRCEAPIKEQFVVCPQCGTKLRPSCPHCAAPVESDWKVCPKCTQPLPEMQTDIQHPIVTKDKSIWKVLAIVILIPALLIAILVLSLSFSAFSSGSLSFREISVSEYYDVIGREATSEKVQRWLDSLDLESNHAYALRYDHAEETGMQYFFLIYVPGAGNQLRSAMKQSHSIFGTTLTLELQRTGNNGSLFHVVSSADNAPNLKIKLDGKKIPCDVTVVSYNPTTFDIIPPYDEPVPGA